MSTNWNHTLFPLEEYREHSPEKYEEYELDGPKFGARVLAATEQGDTVQFDPELKENFKYHSEHLAAVGISHALEEDVIWDTSPEVALDYPDSHASWYLFGPEAHSVRPNARWYGAVGIYGDKNGFIEACQSGGHPIPKTQIIRVREGDMPDLEAVSYPSIVKAAQSSGGKSLYEVHSPEELEIAMANVGSEYQIQQKVTGPFLSVQYRVVDGKPIHIATTEQILNGFTHIGNIHPTKYDPRHITNPLAEEIAAAGMEEIFAFDAVAEEMQPGQTEQTYKFIETNPRWTAATYATIAAGKLGVEGWSAYTLDTTLDGPEELELGNLTYDPEKQSGVVIMNNCRFVMEGSDDKQVEVLIAGSLKQQANLKQKLHRVLREPVGRSSISVPQTV